MDRLSQQTGIQSSFRTGGNVPSDPFVELTVFRVVQECLSNIQKHAEASQVQVWLQGMDTGAEVTVKDNGRGFDPHDAGPSPDGKGLGLLSMQERAERVGGSLSVQSSPGAGCQVVLYIPSREVNDGANSNSPGG